MAIVTVSVLPTETVLKSFAVTDWKTSTRVAIQLVNTTSQLFTGSIYRRKYGMSAWAPSTEAGLNVIPAGESRMVDLDSFGTDELEVRGYLDGAGGNIEVGDSMRPGQRA